jgi:hypothetical protein
LVSIFGRATGSLDPLLRGLNGLNRIDHYATFDQAEQLVQIDKWKKRKIKSTKDFLKRLGKGVFPDGIYNGFVVQKHGLPQNLAAKSMGDAVTLHRRRLQENICPNEGSVEKSLEAITDTIPHMFTLLEDIENRTQSNEELDISKDKEPEISEQSPNSSSLQGMTFQEGRRSSPTDTSNPRGHSAVSHATWVWLRSVSDHNAYIL